MLVTLLRLGLRASEAAALTLEDIDWRAGQITVHGKGRRDERLPLPADVGEAIAAYLTRGRPVTGCREVFLRAVAPAGPRWAAAGSRSSSETSEAVCMQEAVSEWPTAARRRFRGGYHGA